MSADDENQDKPYDPTPQKLQQAREKGEVVKSNDLLTAAGYFGLTIALAGIGAQAMTAFGSSMMVMLDQSEQIAELVFEGGPVAALSGWYRRVSLDLLPIFALPALLVIAVLFAQRAIVFAPSKLQPKLSRVSLIQNAKQKFGRSGLFEFVKSFFKLLAYSIVLAVFLYLELPDMIVSVRGAPGQVVLLLSDITLRFLFVVVLISAFIGGIDAIFQYFEHMRKNRMSRKELMDETKNTEGDPYMKQERRARGQAIAAQQMMAEVPKANVVIVNPTHVSVALQWDRRPGTAPVCVAKGVDNVALRMREVAMESGVPIRQDAPTARALYAVTEIGSEVPPDHYRAVAAAIRFADDLRKRAKNGV